MLETMVVHIAEDKFHILEAGTVRNAGHTARCSVGKHHTVHSSLHSHILGKIGKRVVTGLDNLNHITGIGGCHSSSQSLILHITNLSHIIYFFDCPGTITIVNTFVTFR